LKLERAGEWICCKRELFFDGSQQFGSWIIASWKPAMTTRNPSQCPISKPRSCLCSSPALTTLEQLFRHSSSTSSTSYLPTANSLRTSTAPPAQDISHHPSRPTRKSHITYRNTTPVSTRPCVSALPRPIFSSASSLRWACSSPANPSTKVSKSCVTLPSASRPKPFTVLMPRSFGLSGSSRTRKSEGVCKV